MTSVAHSALRESIRVDLTRVAPFAGALRAAPVVALVTFGLAIGSAKTALTLGVGANLVAVVSLVGASKVSMSVVSLDVVGLACATFVGAATAFNTPLHLSVLAIWCFGAGLLVAFGLGPATTGVQSVVAFVVFGRVSEDPVGALSLGALVASGAALEGIALLALRLPLGTRAERVRVGLAYERLASLTDEVGPNAVEVAAELERAAELVARGPTANPAAAQLQSLIDEARRARLELIAIAGLRRRLEPDEEAPIREAIEDALGAADAELTAIAGAIRSRARRDHLGAAERNLAREIVSFDTLVASSFPGEPLATQLLTHLQALAGQLRAVITQLVATSEAGPDEATPVRRRRERPSIARLLATASADLAIVRGSLTLSSSAFRHALRLAVAVPGADVIATALDLPRGYWVAFAVAVVLKPDYSSLFRRGLGRVLGTILGATLAALFVGGLHPDTAVTVVLVALCAWAAYALWQASFAVGVGFVTALVLFLLSTTQLDTLSTATDRLIDTVLGGAIALGVYIAWPTWSSKDAYVAIGLLIETERNYLGVLFSALEGDAAARPLFSSATRAVRVAFGEAEAAIARSADEPRRHRVDDEFARSVLGAARRIAQSAHSLRSELERGLSIPPLPAFVDLAALLDQALALHGLADGAPRTAEALPLRQHYLLVARALAERGSSPVIALQLDEIVDAVNTLDAIVADRGEPAGRHLR